MSTLREALEAALVENPDDLAAHMAYADHLHDLGDPRGELIQVQLALEDAEIPSEKRRELQAREEILLREERETCLGRRLAVLLDREGNRWSQSVIQRGWLSEVRTHHLDRDLARCLQTSPQARLLRKFTVDYLVPDDPHEEEYFVQGHTAGNLRILNLGAGEDFAREPDEVVFWYNSRDDFFRADRRFWEWVTTFPRLEELRLSMRTWDTERLFGSPTLSHLRVLHLTHSEHYPLDVLAGNPALANLTHLTLHALAPDRDEGRLYLGPEQLRALAYSPYLTSLTHLRFQRSDIGDEGVRLLIESGLFRRLRLLDLSLGTITDTGATLLAQAQTSGIEHLNLTDNAISPEGLRRLAQTLGNRLALSIENQHPPEDEEWLYWGEME